MQRTLSQSYGFTLIEMIVTIVIIGILVTLVVFSPKTFLVTARDSERADDVTSIGRRLEQSYINQDLGTPSYPSTDQLLADISNKTRTMARLKDDAFRAPGASASSVVTASPSVPAGSATPPISQYIYQPLKADGTLCTGTSICVRYFLYYRLETKNEVKIMKSVHQQ